MNAAGSVSLLDLGDVAGLEEVIAKTRQSQLISRAAYSPLSAFVQGLAFRESSPPAQPGVAGLSESSRYSIGIPVTSAMAL